MTFHEIFDLMESIPPLSDSSILQHLKGGAILKLTGGEPLIQQKQLIKFMESFVERYQFTPTIDFETNATIMPHYHWVDKYNATFTTSPKLSSNGDPREKTYKRDVLAWHAGNGSGFKFVVQDSTDLLEIWRDYVNDGYINVEKNRIWLMPCAGSRDEHIEVAPTVAEWAKTLGVKFSPRLHLLIWDLALKV
tara:strand:- start:239 stop:814 length:576 start_codon:yes stop_codon:yes gene_type:complete